MSSLGDLTVLQALKFCNANDCVDPRKNSRGCIALKAAVYVMFGRHISWKHYFKHNPWMRDAVSGYVRVFGHGYKWVIDNLANDVAKSILSKKKVKLETGRLLAASPADVVTVAGLEYDWTTICGMSKPSTELENAIVLACYYMGFSKDEIKAAIGFPMDGRYQFGRSKNFEVMAAHIKNVLCNLTDGGLDAIYGTNWIHHARGVLRDRPPHYAMLKIPDFVAVAAAHQYRSDVEKLIESRLGRAMADRIPLLVERGPVQDDRDADEPQRPAAKQRYAQL